MPSEYTMLEQRNPPTLNAMDKLPLGMSLLKLLICIAVLATLATSGASSFTPLVQKYQMHGASQGIYFLLQQARSMAITMQQDIAVDIHAGTNWCIALTTAHSCDCTIKDNCLVNNAEWKISVEEYDLTQVTKITFGTNMQTVFSSPRGLTAGNAGSLVLSDGRHELKVLLSNMGRVRICALTQGFSPYKQC